MIKQTMQRLLRDTRGATALEYGLLVALITIGSIATMMRLGTATSTGLKGSLEKISAAIEAVKKP